MCHTGRRCHREISFAKGELGYCTYRGTVTVGWCATERVATRYLWWTGPSLKDKGENMQPSELAARRTRFVPMEANGSDCPNPSFLVASCLPYLCFSLFVLWSCSWRCNALVIFDMLLQCQRGRSRRDSDY